ncbi:hypothetical protein COCNU_08G004330 [Cocos nucifera]|uniref:Uncharacterized protein n=1 Tax=Cocos nucifera TaxID=13894 RepID=A0A8K0II00_COCNU|nr:hypothetical protein COCNU_08G004330 [Cocos nucifera]
MGQQGYTRLNRRWRRAKGFRLNCNRFAVFRPRLRLFSFFGLLDRCLRFLKEGFRGSDPRRCGGSSSARGLVSAEGKRGGQPEFKLRSCVRSNSFYAEAIADCLEFIKRSSVPVENNPVVAGAGR